MSPACKCLSCLAAALTLVFLALFFSVEIFSRPIQGTMLPAPMLLLCTMLAIILAFIFLWLAIKSVIPDDGSPPGTLTRS